MRNAAIRTLAGLLLLQVCFGQVDPWERVRLIESGRQVRIKLTSGSTVKGTMDVWSGDSLSVIQGKQSSVAIPKSDVAEVWMVTGMSRKRKAAYAGLITAGGVGALVGATCATNHCYSEAVPAAISTAESRRCFHSRRRLYTRRRLPRPRDVEPRTARRTSKSMHLVALIFMRICLSKHYRWA